MSPLYPSKMHRPVPYPWVCTDAKIALQKTIILRWFGARPTFTYEVQWC